MAAPGSKHGSQLDKLDDLDFAIPADLYMSPKGDTELNHTGDYFSKAML